MIRLAIGQSLAFLAVIGVNLALDLQRGRPRLGNLPSDLYALVLLPVAAGVIIAALADHLRPRLIFRRGSASLFKPVLGGFLASIVTIAVVGAAVTVWPMEIPDAALLASIQALTVLAFILLCRRVQPGRCLHCNYDIRASTDSGRCPECGQTFISTKRFVSRPMGQSV